jgi:Xaa-Pro aminopeptidase
MWKKEEHEIPRSEFERRIARVRQFARDRDLAGVVVYSAPKIHQWNQTGHVGYLTNWSNLDRITDVMVLVPSRGKAALLVAGVEYMLDQIEEVSWIGQVHLVSSPDPRAISRAFDSSVGGEAATRGARSFGAEIAGLLKTEGLDGHPVTIAGIEAMPVPLYRDLERNLPAGIAEAPDVVAELRQFKTPQEAGLLRRTAEISDSSYERMADVVSPGMWGYELTAEMDAAARQRGADFVYHCMHTAPGTDLKAGKLSVKCHDWRLNRGDYINVNAYVVYKGYWIQSDRAGTIGPVLDRAAAGMVEANLQVQDEVLRAIRPGLPIGELIEIGNRAAARFGYEIQGGRIGHGQGLDYSERPFLLAGSHELLQPGHVFVLHVCLGEPGGTLMINPIADLCYLTADGVEVLNKFPRGLFHL